MFVLMFIGAVISKAQTSMQNSPVFIQIGKAKRVHVQKATTDPCSQEMGQLLFKFVQALWHSVILDKEEVHRKTTGYEC